MKILRILTLSAMFLAAENATAATGEMGTGVPHFGIYSAATGMQIVVFSIASPTRPFPAGCTNIVLTPGTMGLDTYKMAMATLTAASLAGRQVRFYAHGERDGGCGVDFVQLD
jgi:ABC-type enterochelin transport system permease subunit